MKTALCLALALSCLALISGCGDDGDGGSAQGCVSLCTEAQAGDCTAITGDCGAFCGAVDNLQGPGGCVDERNAYQACLNVGLNVCDNNCEALENAMGNCLFAYCATNLGDPDCQTLAGSF